MSSAVLFAIIFVGFFVLRAVIATIVFYWILPDDGRCPNCDTPTLRMQSRGARWFTSLRPSWCYECGWHGVLRSNAPQPSRISEAIQASFRSVRRNRRST